MLFKHGARLLVFAATCALAGACAFIPDFGGSSMSNSEKATLNLQMGVRYLDMGMLDVAQEKLEIAYDLDSGNPETLNALAVFYERMKDDEQATDYYQSAIGKAPDNFSIKNNYGRFLCERGKHEQGMAMLRESLDAPMNKRPWLALSNIGICLIQQNDVVQGEEYFRRALQGNPEYSPALLEMIKISYNKQQFMSARAFLERYLAVAKHSPETLWFAFQTERSLGNQQGADSYKEQLLTAFPTSKEALQVKTAISK
ncbi:type IV pilus biogenesis/stability protein PilW [Methylomonas sp. LL1]|uniref:type IV pilus biogenesis/stability protein PilW n=1 Tax=Methylomonas sp. LL1 TaxID=2785785 RepID=UPI0018C3C23C|nr:type IV pilus biogenesis/stability protein PilW [Methylomonas sp. LL1]QPK63168.1 type IV pilus biogenesis/stability protein PilW [Methylomonas sp. LL1]